MARALGTDDSINECDCCGRVDLKFTVAIELDSGEIVHYGQVCAGRNTGKSRSQIAVEIKTESTRVRAAANAEYHASLEFVAYQVKLTQRNRDRSVSPGVASMKYVEVEALADDAARARIAAKHGLKSYELN